MVVCAVVEERDVYDYRVMVEINPRREIERRYGCRRSGTVEGPPICGEESRYLHIQVSPMGGLITGLVEMGRLVTKT